MADGHGEARRALRQFLETDQFFGLREVPVPRKRAVAAAPPADGSGLPGASARTPTVRGAEVGTGTGGEPGPAVPVTTGPVPVVRQVEAASAEDRAAQLAALDANHVRGCQKCRLHATRTNTVFGTGHVAARLVFVGEGPGADEDRQGEPFVGRAGELLTRMIRAMGLSRDQVYICNVVKCRPPGNRTPSTDEMTACGPYLFEQLRIINPEVIVALGLPAARTLLQTGESMGQMRGRFHQYQPGGPLGPAPTIPVMPTYHPAYLLRSPGEKKKVWDDLQKVMVFLGLPLPEAPS